jgi:large subunit ribosomal protein L6
MSRIGNVPVPFGEEVTVSLDEANRLTVTGPKGELSIDVDPELSVEIVDDAVVVERPTDQKRHRALHGLYHSVVENVVNGVTEGHRKELELRGIGYSARLQRGRMQLELGFSHPIVFVPPEEVDITVNTDRNHPRIIVEGVDKQLVGEVAAKIRALRPPEAYKGKGIRYVGEHITLKPGKAAVR